MYILSQFIGEMLIRVKKQPIPNFLQNKSLEIAIKIYEELFKMDFTDLIIDLGLNENDAEAFGNFNIELHNIIANGKVKTPSSKEKGDK